MSNDEPKRTATGKKNIFMCVYGKKSYIELEKRRACHTYMRVCTQRISNLFLISI